MAVTHKQLIAPQKLTTNPTTLYTVDDGVSTQIRAFSVVNTTNATVMLSVWLGGVSDTSKIEQKALASGESYLCTHAINHILKSGDKITASGDGLSILVSGAEIT